jgi:hypothetical protein
MSASPIFSSSQLSSASGAAVANGVPVNIVRGVTGYKYGNGATEAEFTYVAQQLKQWYTSFFRAPGGGDALSAWSKAAAQEMPGASQIEIETATSNQTVATETQGGAVLAGSGSLLGGALADAEGAGLFGALTEPADSAAADAPATAVDDATGADETSDQSGGRSGSGAGTAAKGAAVAGAAGVAAAAASSLSGDFAFLGSAAFWKGIGLVLAGGLIIIFAALEFKNMSGA